MDWLAGALELAGLWLIGSGRRVGFIVAGAGCAFWVGYCLTSRAAYGLLPVVVPALALHARAWLRWPSQRR